MTDRPDAPTSPTVPSGHTPRHLGVLLVLFLVSGAAALVYQVLWVRQLGLLFGSTAQAAALTIAIFFAGLALGGWRWGARSARTARPLRLFGWLEIGVAVTALGHFVLLDAYHALYPALYAAVGHVDALDTAAKALVATVVLLPPAVLMGGTLPLLGQHLVHARDRLATTGATLYAVNTVGSALGALAAGFVLPLTLGLRGAYLLAVAADLTVGTLALLRSRRVEADVEVAADTATAAADDTLAVVAAPGVAAAPAAPTAPAAAPRELVAPAAPVAGALSPRLVWVVAFVSGVVTLAVEVVWTRAFAQVLQNSAYTYSLVLATFLLALSLGAAIAGVLVRQRRLRPRTVLAVLLLACAALVVTSPWTFHALTDGLSYLGADLDWTGYLVAVAALAAVAMLLPATVLGVVLPFLLTGLAATSRAPGDAIGRLVAVNTVGGIVGSLSAGFVLLPWLGAWRTLALLAVAYLGVAIAVADPWRALVRPRAFGRAAVAGVAALGLVAAVAADPAGLTTVRTDDDERLLALHESAQAVVAVVGDDRGRSIRVDNHYTLGGTRAAETERDQSVLPMLLHPDPRRVFHLGMGTGITAGATLAFDDVERVEVCELLDDVVEVARDHFEPWTGGLFDDPRATVHAEDGRTCLRRSDATYDLIVSDLFTPWEAGTGNLYTREQYELGRDRLADGGWYVQWVPLYQVSERELAVIAATMDAVFPQVTMWRGDLHPRRSIVALVGQLDDTPLDAGTIGDRGRQLDDGPGVTDELVASLVLRRYVGNVTASGWAADAPINTDDRPLIEYEAPRTHRGVRAGSDAFVVGDERERVYRELRRRVPVADDPYLGALDVEGRGHVRAGHHLSAAALAAAAGRDDEADREQQAARQLAPPGTIQHRSPARRLLPPDPAVPLG